MIETREHLIHVLSEAAQIEHNLLCSYLYAAFSLKRAGEPGLSAAQSDAVERWRKTIVKVALEEMAHLATVNNLLVAVGGAPHFDRPNFPLPPGYHPAAVVIRLTPFSAETLKHFIFLERAPHQPVEEAPGFEPADAEREPAPQALTPSAADYATIGELYDSISEGLVELCGRLGEAQLIDPTGARQLDEEIGRLPNIRRLTSLDAALEAIRWIKEEGEGSSAADADVESHFERFCAIRDEWRDLSQNDPAFEPAWPAASDPVMRKPAAGLERVWITAQPAARLLDLGNALYGFMLQVLSQAFACEGRREQPGLMNAAVELMEGCAGVATALARLPADPDLPGVTAGLTFAVPRNLGFRPVGVARRGLFAERLAELQRGAAEATRDLPPDSAEKISRRLENALTALSAAGDDA